MFSTLVKREGGTPGWVSLPYDPFRLQCSCLHHLAVPDTTTADSELLPHSVPPQGNSQATGKPNKRWQSQGQDHLLLKQDKWLALLKTLVSSDLSESISPSHHLLRPQHDNSFWSTNGLYSTTALMQCVYQRVISVSIYLIIIKIPTI